MSPGAKQEANKAVKAMPKSGALAAGVEAVELLFFKKIDRFYEFQIHYLV